MVPGFLFLDGLRSVCANFRLPALRDIGLLLIRKSCFSWRMQRVEAKRTRAVSARHAHHLNGWNPDFNCCPNWYVLGVSNQISDQDFFGFDCAREILHVTINRSRTCLSERFVRIITFYLTFWNCSTNYYLSWSMFSRRFHKLVKIAGSQFIRQEASELILYVEKVNFPLLLPYRCLKIVVVSKFLWIILISGLRKWKQEKFEPSEQSSQKTIRFVT